MRYLLPLAVLILSQIGAAWALGDHNVARPGGSYATVEAETPEACERLCANDTLCMAWSFHANACEFKAIVPTAIAQEGVVSGLSTRAPASMRARIEPAQPAATLAVVVGEREAMNTQSAAARPEDEISLALLGGPNTEEDLRVRLGN